MQKKLYEGAARENFVSFKTNEQSTETYLPSLIERISKLNFLMEQRMRDFKDNSDLRQKLNQLVSVLGAA